MTILMCIATSHEGVALWKIVWGKKHVHLAAPEESLNFNVSELQIGNFGIHLRTNRHTIPQRSIQEVEKCLYIPMKTFS